MELRCQFPDATSGIVIHDVVGQSTDHDDQHQRDKCLPLIEQHRANMRKQQTALKSTSIQTMCLQSRVMSLQ